MNREQVRIKLIEWIAELVTEWQSRTSESDRSDLINGLTDKILALDQPQEEIECQVCSGTGCIPNMKNVIHICGAYSGSGNKPQEEIEECKHKYHFVNIQTKVPSGERYAIFVCEYCGKEKKVLIVEIK